MAGLNYSQYDAIRYIKLTEDDGEFEVTVQNAQQQIISFRLSEYSILVRADNLLLIDSYHARAKGVDAYSTGVDEMSEYSLGQLSLYPHGLWILKSTRTGAVAQYQIETSSLEASWCYRGCRIVRWENPETGQWKGLGVVVRGNVRAFKTLSPAENRMLKFFVAYLEGAEAARAAVTLERHFPWCAICNEPMPNAKAGTYFCSDSCKIKAGVT